MKTAGLGHRICPCCMEDTAIMDTVIDRFRRGS